MVSKVEKTRNKGGRPKGLPKTGGRKKGTPNKATRAIREIAQKYTEEAILALVRIMKDHEAPPAAQVSAARELLDRAHGKPMQSVNLGSEEGFSGVKVTIVRES